MKKLKNTESAQLCPGCDLTVVAPDPRQLGGPAGGVQAGALGKVLAAVALDPKAGIGDRHVAEL